MGGREEEQWVVCADSLKLKQEWMKMIANIKVSNGQAMTKILKNKNSYTVSLGTK